MNVLPRTTPEPAVQPDAFAEKLAADLRSFSRDLLDVGLSAGKPTRLVSQPGAGASSHAVVRAAERLATLVPGLLDAVESTEGSVITDVRTTASPVRAWPSSRPSDYALHEPTGERLPIRWLQPTHSEVPLVPPLRWLAHVIQGLRDQVLQHKTRLGKYVEDATLARAGRSEYAALDQERLEAVLAPVQRAVRLLDGADALVRSRLGRGVAPSSRLPDPFPMAQVWRSLRRDAALFTNPMATLPDLVRSLLTSSDQAADVPFLYQRWSGLQMLRAFESFGWTSAADPTGPLFLGGCIELQSGQQMIELWVEPRLTRDKAARIGWRPSFGGELTPDFLLVTRTRGGRDVFVLDPTLATSPEALATKGRYLESLQGQDTLMVAGVPSLRSPVQSWACAPLTTTSCRLADPAGHGGTIPMHPLHWRPEPLRAWVGDVLRFVKAWG